jgi:hypothetical protein
MVALGVCEAVECALVIACSMARRVHSWSYCRSAMCVARGSRWMRRLRLRGIVSGRCESVGIC